MTLEFTECPASLDEVADAYIMGTLTKAQAKAFEDHYAGCDQCATVLQETVEYIEAMRAAARNVRSD